MLLIHILRGLSPTSQTPEWSHRQPLPDGFKPALADDPEIGRDDRHLIRAIVITDNPRQLTIGRVTHRDTTTSVAVVPLSHRIITSLMQAQASTRNERLPDKILKAVGLAIE
ncbi:hypothetical protein [Kibdelosporangium persicum]|uniref:hypothetical protein n=1 Tax=Kibdelosporangium persicum TaxID=2698649 RepID=UPI001566CADF|nr:hypothetical protein [Kibdelosporangium persicum]